MIDYKLLLRSLYIFFIFYYIWSCLDYVGDPFNLASKTGFFFPSCKTKECV